MVGFVNSFRRSAYCTIFYLFVDRSKSHVDQRHQNDGQIYGHDEIRYPFEILIEFQYRSR